ncbi:zinc finger CCHC-type and RNA-binding motif-containing protein 1-like [Sabethes cyaneus]|uniref:zinc finger CCHC-type and RNA-binding motif-containing protein 1-like n=1 Tax=Sabethes cyaneus TaxID=53552 RepID=UPI00237EDC68|nr:zinc finger CCHC-type and RNA-binding motif-containing protein 1-like [Sabethes cyaneus]
MSSQTATPVRSTVYVANLPFDLTNIDVRKLFEKYGQIARVTILRDRHSRKSQGVAFVLFTNSKDAEQCCTAVNNVQMFGRTVKASIAKDNGRGPQFAKRREYPDKSRCYECGEHGHVSYKCPKNVLGDKSPPRTKCKKRVKNREENGGDAASDEDDRIRRIVDGSQQTSCIRTKRIRYKKSEYFSDDEEIEDD